MHLWSDIIQLFITKTAHHHGDCTPNKYSDVQLMVPIT